MPRGVMPRRVIPPLRRLGSRLVNALRPGRAERDLARELAAHIALLEDEYRRRGMPPEDARRAAALALGGVEQTKELHRAARSFAWFDDARGDVSYGTRTMIRNAGFSLAVVTTIGVAIGGIGAVFSLVDAVLVRPLPYRDAARIVTVWEDNTKDGFPRNSVEPAHYALLAAQNGVFESMAAVAGYGATFSDGGTPEKIEARRVTHAFFDVLGVAPALGRVFHPEEDQPGGRKVTLLSHRFWRDRFGADPAIVGRDILFDNDRFSIIGVMPAGFQFLDGAVSAWVPAAFGPDELRKGSNYLTVIARLDPDVTVARAEANLDAVSAGLPGTPTPTAAEPRKQTAVVPLHELVTGETRRPLIVLLAAVGAVMLIACANVASLLLARAAARRHEIALRGALGASRGRIVRQLVTESLLLSALGFVVGIVLAKWALVFLEQLVPPGMMLFARPALDLRALGFTALASLTAGVLFGLAPAIHAAKPDAGSILKGSGRGIAGAESRRGVLVVAEVAMTLMLLVVAGLLIQTLYRLRYADIGFRPQQVLTLRTTLPSDRYGSHARRMLFYDEVLERVARVPGVVAAGYTTSVPLAWKGATTGFIAEGRAFDPAQPVDVNHRQVSAGYLQAIGIPVMQGRYFDERDQANAQPVVIINETMARQYWPGISAIGKRIRPTDDEAHPAPWLTIVGVVGDVRQMGLDEPVKAEMYVPYRQFDSQAWFAPRDLAVRTIGDPTQFAGAIAREIHAVDAAQPVSHVRLMTYILDQEVAARRIGTVVLLAFAGFAVLLAVVGIYGVISFFVVQHTPEIGVRIALGAQRRQIVTLVAGRGVSLAVIGLAIGAAGSAGATRIVASLLYGVTAFDAITLASSSLLLLSLALVASYLPARRAARLDPIAALRER
jgi:predicted permease